VVFFLGTGVPLCNIRPDHLLECRVWLVVISGLVWGAASVGVLLLF
jgi:hypothetical protein